MGRGRFSPIFGLIKVTTKCSAVQDTEANANMAIDRVVRVERETHGRGNVVPDRWPPVRGVWGDAHHGSINRWPQWQVLAAVRPHVGGRPWLEPRGPNPPAVRLAPQHDGSVRFPGRFRSLPPAGQVPHSGPVCAARAWRRGRPGPNGLHRAGPARARHIPAPLSIPSRAPAFEKLRKKGCHRRQMRRKSMSPSPQVDRCGTVQSGATGLDATPSRPCGEGTVAFLRRCSSQAARTDRTTAALLLPASHWVCCAG